MPVACSEVIELAVVIVNLLAGVLIATGSISAKLSKGRATVFHSPKFFL